jgi:hypothetical protein
MTAATIICILMGPFGRPMPEPTNEELDRAAELLYRDAVETPAETVIENEDSLARFFYDDDLDEWRHPDNEPIGGELHTGPYPEGVFPTPQELRASLVDAINERLYGDTGDECSCPACKANTAAEFWRDDFTVNPFETTAAREAAEFDREREATVERRMAETPFQRVLRQADEPTVAFDPDKRQRLLDDQQRQAAQQASAYFAERRENRRRLGDLGMNIVWSDPAGAGGRPLYSISHWGVH